MASEPSVAIGTTGVFSVLEIEFSVGVDALYPDDDVDIRERWCCVGITGVRITAVEVGVVGPGGEASSRVGEGR